MAYHLPKTPTLGIFDTVAGKGVLAHEKVQDTLYVHSTFDDPLGRCTYEIRKVDFFARVRVLDEKEDVVFASDLYDSLDLARAAVVQALIFSAQEILDHIRCFLPEDVMGITAHPDAPKKNFGYQALSQALSA